MMLLDLTEFKSTYQNYPRKVRDHIKGNGSVMDVETGHGEIIYRNYFNLILFRHSNSAKLPVIQSE